MKNKTVLMIMLFLFLCAVAAISLFIGSVKLSFAQLLSPEFRAILILRFSRITVAAVCGASLAAVGAILQGLLRNPLADPYVLGISSGSGLGAVLAIVLGGAGLFGAVSLPLYAFIGGLAAIAFVYFLSKKASRVSAEDLLLSGVIVTSMLSGVIMFVVSVMETEGLHSALWWLLGNTQVFDLRIVFVTAAVSLTGIVISIAFGRSLNIMSLGEEEAIGMGLDVERVKLLFFIITSVITAAVVSVCGMIGFVGLIIPHAARRIIGPGHRRLIPASALLGAAFLVLCDTLSRTIMPPMELPVGVVTALIGGPVFLVILKQSRKAKV